MSRPIRKRSYLLFEIVLSLILVALCFFPLIKPHVFIGKKEMEKLAKMRPEIPVTRAFCLVKMRLYGQKKHPWDQLQRSKAEGVLDETFKIGKTEYRCHYRLECVNQSTKGTQDSFLVLQVHLEFKNPQSQKSFPYVRFLCVEKVV